jgi:hypothetical protein
MTPAAQGNLGRKFIQRPTGIRSDLKEFAKRAHPGQVPLAGFCFALVTGEFFSRPLLGRSCACLRRLSQCETSSRHYC